MDEAELQDKINARDMMEQYKKNNQDKDNNIATEEKKTGIIRIGVFEPSGDDQVQGSGLQQYLAGVLTSGKIEAVSIGSEEDIAKYSCDYTLFTKFTKIKQVNKVGGLLKAIKNTDPNAASSFTIEALLTLKNVADGSTKLEQSLSGKYEGKVDEAARKALDEGSRLVLKGLK